ncbi:helix-turn-helix domain-containing protein [Streptomyces sp. NPDC096176]|uniref:helix-turn-helix domain-containing protein n=1 Tax=Streptomyces sp. NPDC096176 TaxID=3366079 RepID=UPI00380AD41C
MWIEKDGSAVRAARHMLCHRNTVLNRLRRFEQIKGLELSRPRDLVRLTLASTRSNCSGWRPSSAAGKPGTPTRKAEAPRRYARLERVARTGVRPPGTRTASRRRTAPGTRITMAGFLAADGRMGIRTIAPLRCWERTAGCPNRMD